MDFLQTLRAHRGGLLHIKGELYWYGGRGWDGTPDRICLLLDAATLDAVVAVLVDAVGEDLAAATAAEASSGTSARFARVIEMGRAVLLLIDGTPQWVWVCKEDVELIT